MIKPGDPGLILSIIKRKLAMQSSRYLKIVFIVTAFLLIVLNPYITAYRMQNAVENGDVQSMAKFINYANVKYSIKESMLESIFKESNKSDTADLMNMAVAAAALDPLIDFALLPNNFLMMLKGVAPSGEDVTAHLTHSSSSQMGYEDLNTFIMKVANSKLSKQGSIQFIFNRHHLLFWQLNAIKFKF